MPTATEWSVPPEVQPKPGDYNFDLNRALTSVVGVRANNPDDAFTSEVLGTERGGNGAVIRSDGVILTIGYLIVEAESVWIHLADGRLVPGHVLAYDQETGFGMVQALAKLDLPALPLGNSGTAKIGEHVVAAGAGGRAHSVAARLLAKQEFAGYWEYVLDEALFTGPAHPLWGGSALIGSGGELLGIGSLQLQRASKSGKVEDINMYVPIDLLKPIQEELMASGRTSRPPRPWLGLYATEVENRVVVAGLASQGPAKAARLKTGDILLAAAGEDVHELADLWRRLWSLGTAGVEVPLVIYRDGRALEVTVVSANRDKFLKGPRLQ